MFCKSLDDLHLDEGDKIGYTYKCMGAGFWALRQNNFRAALEAIAYEVTSCSNLLPDSSSERFCLEDVFDKISLKSSYSAKCFPGAWQLVCLYAYAYMTDDVEDQSTDI